MSEATVASQSKEIQRVFNLQKQSQWKMKNTTAAERVEILNKLREALQFYREDVDEALFQDLGREKNSAEVYMMIKELDYIAENLQQWMQYELHDHPTIPTAKYYTEYEPRGVVLIMNAWNFPFDLTFSPLVAALAAGNTAIVKPNGETANCSRVIANIIERAFEEDVVACFEGRSPVAAELQKLPFDHVFFTGSPNVGKTVMEAAAKNLTSVTLELGGRSPLILDETADLKAIAQGVGICKTVNSGQICLAINHIFAPRSKVDELVEEVKNYLIASCYTENEFQPQKIGKIINERNYDRVVGYVDDALEKGATIAFGGNNNKEILSIEPTILTNVQVNSAVVENEIFAPIIPIIAYDDVEEAISHVNAGGKPLGMFIFSSDEEFTRKILNNTSCGGVTINSWALHANTHELPFGGINESGMGSYHGIHGFKELSHARPVFKTF